MSSKFDSSYLLSLYQLSVHAKVHISASLACSGQAVGKVHVCFTRHVAWSEPRKSSVLLRQTGQSITIASKSILAQHESRHAPVCSRAACAVLHVAGRRTSSAHRRAS